MGEDQSQATTAIAQRWQNAVSTIVHELKSPATSLTTLLQTLEQRMQGRDEKDIQLVRMSLKQTERMTLLINDLLDIARIEQGHLQYRFQPIAVKPLVQDLMHGLVASHPAHAFDIDIQSESVIWADRLRMEQAITNIITNAMKYSPAETLISVRVHDDKENVIIAVADQGIGITPEQQRHLFDLYYRAPNASNVKGLGIGLPLSYGIVKAHKGDIEVSSEAGRGSTFRISLPKQEEREKEGNPTSS